MAYSRASIPLFSVALLVLTVYMLYLILWTNIFNIPALDDSSLHQNAFATAEDSHYPVDQHSTFDSQTLKKIFTPTTKKTTQSESGNPDHSQSHADTQLPGQSLSQTEQASSIDSMKSGGAIIPTKTPQQIRAYELKILWDKYSARVPRLYSSPLSSMTETTLGRVGVISMNLDLLYPQDQGAWMLKVEGVREELIAIAAKGEREAVRALSFQYFRAPLNKTIESLAWAMIANAIAPNEYYLTICMASPEAFPEEVFVQASEQALNNVANYGFVVRK
ncbi:hypothetical protein GCM10011613_01020 [Cellvibrio zantedeschiae]|uniref:Uncharacterized protein n=1 Tax=Cellvibrio zantedeschiae TaxID=1237077 RepID=A0ABQ3ANB2_9GAMM|nr:hypothetical protein [Cellvibrio zantedeschiae]GGY61422.1 hypothetical protein GCM10011613_01020 [Cellvibrio zantedeschiae]